ncbi:SDR family oxidoreductase [Pseudomonas alliivorans]|uniref:SDR family oxidoreductase n=1 Tax=Pseudomonas alliivorans TaxID=2810613 RepID=A0ABS4C2R8_9PSED|nr:SDR family oxidoreductase [Pseudomonas alliivorans]MBP0944947.1 SDR family oxidoreductase [Pseudomonas alliivorans]MEE4324607.1 SDR family oxidoreductase [Pseudomonas alliivorans]MEE4333351.1 SDR family oxidoreductase [Pseudomonas alliivorans]MEE4341622.1 SDR family oxidoreductase [Pseudomonas alliivorans]MEE4366137.1 SDR family oxidoreductase [Pseudomonas alliivorans]
MRLFDLSGQTAFVTGAGSGIGQAIAIGLAEAGAHVACFDLPGSRDMSSTLEGIQRHGRKALALEGSVTSPEELEAAVARTEQDLGALSLAVNAAGIANAQPAEALELSRWQQMLDVNLTGIMLSCQAQARVMLPRQRGSIINIASMSGIIVNRGLLQAHYNTSKAGVIHLSKSLAMEWAQRGVRVNSISPGYTATPMNTRPEVADQVKIFEETTPLGRMATVDEMVGPAIFLSSQAASFCTGIDLIVDGGFVCW